MAALSSEAGCVWMAATGAASAITMKMISRDVTEPPLRLKYGRQRYHAMTVVRSLWDGCRGERRSVYPADTRMSYSRHRYQLYVRPSLLRAWDQRRIHV